VKKHQLINNCDLFKRDPSLLDSGYRVRSEVSTLSCTTFVSALKGQAITISIENHKDLLFLCEEFCFESLRSILSTFESSEKSNFSDHSNFQTKIAKLEEKVFILKRRNAKLEDQILHETAELSKIHSFQATFLSRIAALELGTQKLEVPAPPIPFDPIEFIGSLRKNSEDYEEIRYLDGRDRLVRELSSGSEFVISLNDSSINARMFAIPLILNLRRVVRAVGFYADERNKGMLWIVTPFFQNGSLGDVLKQLHAGHPPAGFGPTQLSKLAFGIAFMMSRFHLRDGIHGLFSPDYVLLDDRFEPLICCSFFTRLQHENFDWIDDYSLASTGRFLAPEIIRHDHRKGVKESDVYSFAILLYSLFADPFQSMKRYRGGTEYELHRWIIGGRRFPRPPNVSQISPAE
jgi:hypothetical protein